MTPAQLVKKINACAKRIEVERDKLRDLENEASIMADSATEAIESLEAAAAKLSEYF